MMILARFAVMIFLTGFVLISQSSEAASDCSAIMKPNSASNELSASDAAMDAFLNLPDLQTLLLGRGTDEVATLLKLPADQVREILKARFQSLKWKSLAEGRFKALSLFSFGTANAVLYQLAAGFPVKPHLHPEGESSIVIRGSFFVGDVEFKAGERSYRAPGTTDPASHAGPEGALIFVYTPVPVKPLE